MTADIAGILTRHTDWTVGRAVKESDQPQAHCECGYRLRPRDGDRTWYTAQRRHQERLIRAAMRDEEAELISLLRSELDQQRTHCQALSAEVATLMGRVTELGGEAYAPQMEGAPA